jgi:hypothetical protein
MTGNAPTPPSAATPPAGPGTTDLINAVRAGDVAKISALIASGADVNERDRAGQRTALHWAAKSNNRPAMEVLIAATRKEKVSDRFAVAENSGLKPLVIDVESFAQMSALELVINQLPGGGKEQNVAIVDVALVAVPEAMAKKRDPLLSITSIVSFTAAAVPSAAIATCVAAAAAGVVASVRSG